jgi:hypothetical protein
MYVETEKTEIKKYSNLYQQNVEVQNNIYLKQQSITIKDYYFLEAL